MKNVTFNTNATGNDAGTSSSLTEANNEMKGDSSSNVPAPEPSDPRTATGATIS